MFEGWRGDTTNFGWSEWSSKQQATKLQEMPLKETLALPVTSISTFSTLFIGAE